MTAELAYGNHPSVVPHAVAVHEKIFAEAVHGRALVFGLLSAANILGLRVSPSAVILDVKFHIIHYLNFARAGARTSVDRIPVFLRATLRAGPRASWWVVTGVVFAADARP